MYLFHIVMEDGTDRRIHDRMPSRTRIGYHGPEGRIASRLRDISRTGCRLAVGSSGLSVGQKLAIELVDSISIQGIVRWIDGDEAGIEFTICIHETMLQVLVEGADNVCFFPLRSRMEVHDQFGRALPLLGGGRRSRDNRLSGL